MADRSERGNTNGRSSSSLSSHDHVDERPAPRRDILSRLSMFVDDNFRVFRLGGYALATASFVYAMYSLSRTPPFRQHRTIQDMLSASATARRPARLRLRMLSVDVKPSGIITAVHVPPAFALAPRLLMPRHYFRHVVNIRPVGIAALSPEATMSLRSSVLSGDRSRVLYVTPVDAVHASSSRSTGEASDELCARVVCRKKLFFHDDPVLDLLRQGAAQYQPLDHLPARWSSADQMELTRYTDRLLDVFEQRQYRQRGRLTYWVYRLRQLLRI